VLKIGQSERTRAAILETALEFIWSHPFRDMTVSSLMARTGVTRSAFYQYFTDRHHVMEALLGILQADIMDSAAPWLTEAGDPVALAHESLAGLVRICHQRGPLVRAVADAATTDERLEKDWGEFLGRFEDAATARIEADQNQGLIPVFDARHVSIALTRLDTYTLIEAFGQEPRREPELVRKALTRIWIATLYGAKWVEKESSTLVRK